MSRVEWDIINSKVKELAKYGLIELAIGNCAAATVLPVKKDENGNYTDRRMCGDSRALNLKTEHDQYPMPILKDMFDTMDECKYFPIMDMRQRFNQIEMCPVDKEKTAFSATQRRWQWKVITLCLKNAGACF